MFFCYLFCQRWTDITNCSSVSIADFEQLNVGWEWSKFFNIILKSDGNDGCPSALNIWDKIFKSGLSAFSGRQLLKKLLRPLSAAGLFKYVWPICYHQALKG